MAALRDRNDHVWNNKEPNSAFSLSKAGIARSEWLSGQTHEHNPGGSRSPRRCGGWHSLPFGWVRCSVDVAFFASQNMTSLGMVLQGNNGDFMTARVLTLQGCLRVMEGEAMGVHEAFSWIKQKHLQCVEVTTDNKVVVDALLSHDIGSSEFGAIIASYGLLLVSCPTVKVKFVRRDANVVAHRLARSAIDFPNTYIWDEPPNVVDCLLHVQCICV